MADDKPGVGDTPDDGGDQSDSPQPEPIRDPRPDPWDDPEPRMQLELQVAALQADLAREPDARVARLLQVAIETSQEIYSASRRAADQILNDAHAAAEAMIRDADQTVRGRIDEMEKQAALLVDEVASLRSFEREYRSRLRYYFQEQLEALTGVPVDHPDHATPAGKPSRTVHESESGSA